jgi:hypothetical protein
MPARQIITRTGVIAAVAIAAAGCGSVSPSGGVAHSSQGPAQTAFAFAHCMRDHGVRNFPDPVVSSSGSQTTIKQVAPASAVSSPAFKSAQRACASFAPSPQNNQSTDQGPGKRALLAFARCLRAHGISNFPDPNAQGRLTLEMVSAAGINVHAPGFFGVARGCLGVTNGAITSAQLAAAINGHH